VIALKKSQIQSYLIKFAALCASFLLWLYVLSSAQTKAEKILHINYILPEGLALLERKHTEVKYTIEGPRAIVRKLLSQESKIDINLKNYYAVDKTDYEITLDTLDPVFPFGVKISEIQPKKIDVVLDKKLIKKIPVVLQTIGNVPSDHKIIQQQIHPFEIQIEGAYSLVKEITQIQTEVFDLTNLTQSDTRKLKLLSFDEKVVLEQKHVDFNIEVKPTRANLIIRNVPIRYLTNRPMAIPNSRTVNVMVLAEDTQTVEIKKKEIKIIAEIPDDKKGQVEIQLQSQMPAGIHLLEIIPASISINL
jgi:YbbR domain-containing protein